MNKSKRNDNHKHKGFISSFKQLGLRPYLHKVKDFYYLLRIFTKNSIQWSTQDPEKQLQSSILNTRGDHKINEEYMLLTKTKIINSLYNFLEFRDEI